MDPIKLQKFFTDCGVLSRRAAEAEIAAGKVKVNGTVAELGQRIDPASDKVEYRGRIIRPTVEERVCIMLNKPRGFVTTLSDEKNRPTVADLVSDLGKRVYPVGRLDMDSDGLLLLTDDGELTNRLTHPRHEIPKIYRVTVGGQVYKLQLERLCTTMNIDGYDILPVKTEILSFNKDRSETVLRMELFEGRNRQIRKMCSAVGLTVLRLQRIAIGDLTLGDLKEGKWRRLTKDEIDYLYGRKNKSLHKENQSC